MGFNGAVLRLYDPMPNTQRIFPERPERLSDCSTCEVAAPTRYWRRRRGDEFHDLDLSRLPASMHLPVLLDGSNIYDPLRVREARTRISTFFNRFEEANKCRRTRVS